MRRIVGGINRLCLSVHSGSRGGGRKCLSPHRGLAEPDPDGAVGRSYLANHDRAPMHGRIKRTQNCLQAQRHTVLGGLELCEILDLLIDEAGTAYNAAAGVPAHLGAFGMALSIVTQRPLLT